MIFIAALFCLVLVSGVSLFFYIQTDHARNIALNRVNTIIPGSADLKRFKLSVIGTSIQLEGLTLLDRSGGECLEVQSLFIDIRLSALLNKTIEIVEFRLDHPRILMAMDAEGRINLLDAVVPPDRKPPDEKRTEGKEVDLPFNIVLANAAINNGYFSLAHPENQVTIGDISIKLPHADLERQLLALDTRINQTELLLDSRPVRIHDVHIKTDLKPEGQLTFQAEVGSDILDLTSSGNIQQLFKAPEIDINLSTNARLGALHPLLKDQIGLKGTADLSFSGKGPVSNPRAKVSLKVNNLSINEDLEQGNIKLALSLDDRSLKLDSGQLDLLGARISVSGQTDLAPMFPDGFLNPPADPGQVTYSFSFDQQNGDFQQLTKWIQGFTGRFSTQGHIQGSGINPDTLSLDGRLTFDLNDFKQKDAKIQPLDLETGFSGNLAKGIVNAELLKITAGDSVVNASGRYDIKNQQIKAGLTIDAPDLSRLTGPLGIEPVKGAITSEVKISGRLKTPDISARVMADNLIARRQTLPKVEFEGRLTPSGEAQIKKLTVKDEDVLCDITGSVDLFDPGFKPKQKIKASLSAQGDNINPGTLIKKFELVENSSPFDATLNFNLNLETELPAVPDFSQLNTSGADFPEVIVNAGIDLSEKKIKAHIENILSLQAGLTLNKKQDANLFSSEILFKQSNFNPLLESLGLAGIKLSIDGQIHADGRLPIKLSPGMIETINTAQGKIDLNASLKKNADGPDFNARLNLTGLKGEIGPDLVPGGIRLAAFTGMIEATPEKLSINGIQAKMNEGKIQLSGHALMKNYKISDVVLKLDADRLPVPMVSKNQKPHEIDQLNAELDIAVAYDTPPIPFHQILADIDLTDPGFQIKLDQSTTVNASIRPEPGDYKITADFHSFQLSPYLSLGGITSIHPELNGYIQSTGKLKTFLPEAVMDGLKEATGNISIKASLDGPVKQPAVDAQIRLRDIGYPIPQAGTAISGLKGTIRASQDRLEIQKISASLGSGSFSLDGAVDLEAFLPVKGGIRFNSQDIELEIPDMTEVAFNSDLKFTGDKEKSDLSGTIQLIRGEFYKDFTFSLSQAAGKKKRKKTGPGTKSGTGHPFIERTTLNIDVDYKDPFTIDNNLAFILIEPNVAITGTAANPVVTGRVKIIEGTITYQKKEFEIEKGIIDFVDPYKTDPDIDLIAKSQIRDWLIRLEITGKPDNLNFKLYSEPQETHEDILSLLITGKTTRELGKSDGSYTDVLTEKASDIIGKTVEESTPLDSFKIGYDGSQKKGSNVSVTMGKKLSRRLEVIYSTKTEEDETVHTNAAEYKLLENLMFKAFNDSKGDFGAELKFKLEFR